jgi:periplasmic copper chaperone A
MKTLLKLLMLSAALFPAAVMAQVVQVRDAWIRGTVPAQQATGAFMQITSKVPARLVAVSSPAARAAEIHNMTMENNVMKMFPVDGIDIPAGTTVRLASGGYHVMLLNLHQPLNAGDRVPLRLVFELADKKRETVDLQVEVRDLAGKPRHGHAH